MWARRDGQGGQNHQGYVRSGRFTKTCLKAGRPKSGGQLLRLREAGQGLGMIELRGGGITGFEVYTFYLI